MAKPADAAAASRRRIARKPLDPDIRNEKDLAKYDKIFADVAYWKKLGEEYQTPLIVTGTVLFTPHQANGFVMQQARGLRLVRPPQRHPGAHLPGAQGLHPAAALRLHRRPHRRDPLLRDVPRGDPLHAQQSVPALSTYFELMDRVMPSFLSTLSAQKIRGTRVLLQVGST